MVTGSKVEYVGSGQLLVADYVKNTKAIGFLWGVFSVCYAVISLLVFVQPQWVGSGSTTSPGYFSPWKHCALSSVVTETMSTQDFTCRGRIDDFGSILNPSLRISTILIGLAALLAILSVFALVLFLCAPTSVAYHVVAWIQTVAAISTGLGLLVFPLGWDAPEIKLVCGAEAGRFSLGDCGFRWALVLGILGLLDACVLALLGFVLGSRHIKLSAEGGKKRSKGRSSSSYLPSGFYPTETTTAPPTSVSLPYDQKRPLNLQPILLIPPDNDFSRSKESLYKAEYATPSQQFQL